MGLKSLAIQPRKIHPVFGGGSRQTQAVFPRGNELFSGAGLRGAGATKMSGFSERRLADEQRSGNEEEGEFHGGKGSPNSERPD